MIESIKKKIWDLLKDKEVSLAMLYDREGKILWHRGRTIKGKTIADGERFSKTHIMKTIQENKLLEKEDVVITSSGNSLPHSARVLPIKSLLIQPIGNDLFLYIDSGIKETFTPADVEVFKVMGEMLGQMIDQLKSGEIHVGDIYGKSAAMSKIRNNVLRYSLEEEPILLTGETGVGKNFFAEIIHRTSGRKGKFVALHTPSIPETLFESELFGHKKGSFSDARADKKGLVQEAERGTLFFDEIAEVPISFQAKLLQFIENKKYRILGDTVERRADIRIIAASNRNLMEMIENKTFRQDLYFRLSVLPMEIPPLRERLEDIKDLVENNRQYLKGKIPTPPFWDTLLSHQWPGNVRELMTVLKRAGIELDNQMIGSEIKDIIQIRAFDEKRSDEMEKIQLEIASGHSFWDTAWKQFLRRDISRRVITNWLRRLYHQNNQNLVQLSRELNIKPKEYSRFVTSLHKYHIHPGKQGGES